MECTPGTRVLVDVMVDTQVSEPKHHWILLGQVEINLNGSRIAAALGCGCWGGEGVDGTHRGVTHGRPVHRHLQSAVVGTIDGDVGAPAELDAQLDMRVAINTDAHLEQRVLLDVMDALTLAVYIW